MMTEDAKAILLLAGRFGGNSDAAPLSLSEYNKLAKALQGRDLRPADLLASDCVEPISADSGLKQARISTLLHRGVELGLSVENWNSNGIWVLCRSDDEYPQRLKQKLGSNAPAILFGVGEKRLLLGGGLAIVGSRNVDASGERFTTEVAKWCAKNDVPVVSGGARGVDQFAMKSATDSGGRVIGILADQLLKSSVASSARDAIYNGKLVLVSPYHPKARFNVGNAMSRNKLIYALADAGLVVSTDYKKGGTWAGAVEEIKRAGKVLVRTTSDSPDANSKLLDYGASPFPENWQLQEPASVIDESKQAQLSPDQKTLAFEPSKNGSGQNNGGTSGSHEAVSVEPPTTGKSVYETVLPLILKTLEQEMTIPEIANELDVTQAQLKIWIKRAGEEKLIVKLNKPVRFVRTNQQLVGG